MKLLIMVLLTLQLNAMVLDKDKQQHAIAGTVTYLGCIVLGEILKKQSVTGSVNSKTCVLAAVGIGVAKEVYDSQGYGTPEVMDAVATFAAPMIISYTIEF